MAVRTAKQKSLGDVDDLDALAAVEAVLDDGAGADALRCGSEDRAVVNARTEAGLGGRDHTRNCSSSFWEKLMLLDCVAAEQGA